MGTPNLTWPPPRPACNPTGLAPPTLQPVGPLLPHRDPCPSLFPRKELTTPPKQGEQKGEEQGCAPHGRPGGCGSPCTGAANERLSWSAVCLTGSTRTQGSPCAPAREATVGPAHSGHRTQVKGRPGTGCVHWDLWLRLLVLKLSHTKESGSVWHSGRWTSSCLLGDWELRVEGGSEGAGCIPSLVCLTGHTRSNLSDYKKAISPLLGGPQVSFRI